MNPIVRCPDGHPATLVAHDPSHPDPAQGDVYECNVCLAPKPYRFLVPSPKALQDQAAHAKEIASLIAETQRRNP